MKRTAVDLPRLFRQAVDVWWEHADWRRGQALWNTLSDLHPDVAAELDGTDADCFYDDARISAFWAALGHEGGGWFHPPD